LVPEAIEAAVPGGFVEKILNDEKISRGTRNIFGDTQISPADAKAQGFSMIFGIHFRRQALVCLRLAKGCDDQHLAERLKAMAADLLSKASQTEERRCKNNTSEPVYIM
jgi:hypothetical protein